MNIPGFLAEASLNKANQRYHTSCNAAFADVVTVQPQGCSQPCLRDCLDACPDLAECYELPPRNQYFCKLQVQQCQHSCLRKCCR